MSLDDGLIFDELPFDEPPDILSAMTLPDLRRYVAEREQDDEDPLGLRSLAVHPEALSRSLRRQLH